MTAVANLPVPTVMIGHPYYRTNLSINFYLGMINTITTSPIPLMVELGGDYSVVRARNELIKKFLASDASHLLFVDVDMGLPKGGLMQLLEDDLPIVGALCFQRKIPHNPTLLMKESISDTAHVYSFIKRYKPGLVEVDATGAGVLLIKREVLEKLAYPWFAEPEDRSSEDIFFCEQARQAGYRIFVDTRVKTTHYTEMIISESDFKRYGRG